MNKEQFLEIVRGWMGQATQDVAHQVSNFIETMGTSIEELADALDMNPQELDDIAMGQAELTLEQFAKLLIGTNHVIEIKPIEAAPRGFERQRPQHVRRPQGMERRPRGNVRPPFGGMPTPPMGARPQMSRGAMGGMMPPPPSMGGMPMPPMGTRPPMPRGAMGGMMPTPPNEEVVDETRNFDELSRIELINLIRQNHWDGEINTATATRGTLIDFLEEKFGVVPTPRESRTVTPQRVAPRTEQVNGGNEGVATDTAEARKARLMEMLNRAVSEHPELLDTIEQYMPQA